MATASNDRPNPDRLHPDRPGQDSPALARLDASWRGEYIVRATSDERAALANELTDAEVHGERRCPFCPMFAAAEETTEMIHRGTVAHVILNAYPYTSGHCMVLPHRHVGDLVDLDHAERTALWELVTDTSETMKRAYQPDGINIGINMGRAAGAGLPGHLHVHLVPRWNGDTNFMTVTAETRVIPESLAVSSAKLRAAWPTR